MLQLSGVPVRDLVSEPGDEPVVLVRSRVLRGRQVDDLAVAGVAADLEALLCAAAQRLGVVVAAVSAISAISIEDGDMGAWIRVTRSATGHRHPQPTLEPDPEQSLEQGSA
ncbi:hypothetical protein GCM10027519_48330 [Kineococcus endophyticus]